MRVGRRWTAALEEHSAAVRAFRLAFESLAMDEWLRVPAPGKWSAAAVVLHVCRAYELGNDAAVGGSSMRLLVAPPMAWMARTFALPVFLRTGSFPRGAEAPAEVIPDLGEARQLTPATAVERLRRASDATAGALLVAARDNPALRVTHAYFGALTPLATLRLLSAHTQHHARGLARVASKDAGRRT